MNKGFTKKANQGEYKFERTTSDNKYLKSIQVKDVKSIITDDCILWLDCDSIPYFAASLQDDNYVSVTHIKSGRTMEFKNKTEFKGASRKEGVITVNSWLGARNLEQQAKGSPEFTLEDFEIVQSKRLLHERDTALRYAKKYMKDYLDAILKQSGCKRMICCIGGGSNHRHLELLPEIYKGNRASQERPILLDECREWLKEDYEVVEVEGEEVDDFCQREAYKGSLHYSEHKKYSAMIGAIDKDSLGLPCLNFCYQKKGPMWTNPNPWIISDWEVTGDVGTIEMTEGKCRASSLLQIARQLCTIDSADNYSMYLHLPKELHPKEKYSDTGFYKQFCILKTPKDVLQGVADRYYTTFPNGLSYEAHTGEVIDIDTMTYLEMIFTCVYMLRKPLGEENIKLWFDKYGVDYSKLVNNNAYTAPVKTYIGNESHVKSVEDLLSEIITEDFKGIKSLKKSDQAPVLDRIKEKLMSINFESHYELQQTLKEGFEA